MERDNLPLRICVIIGCCCVILGLLYLLIRNDFYKETKVKVEIVDVIQSENFLGHATYQTKVSYDNEVYTINGDTAYYFAKDKIGSVVDAILIESIFSGNKTIKEIYYGDTN